VEAYATRTANRHLLDSAATSRIALRDGLAERRSRTRLNVARRLPVRPSGSDPARGAAVRSSLRHLGRFASAYRDVFDELPSDTLLHAVRDGERTSVRR
jgi:hypothetical protein